MWRRRLSGAASAVGAIAVVATLLPSCDASTRSPEPSRPTPSVLAQRATDPTALLMRLNTAGITCTPLALDAFQYAPGFSQIHCVRHVGTSVTLRVYDSAAAMRQDRASLATYRISVLAGPNWTALSDANQLETLRTALGGAIER